MKKGFTLIELLAVIVIIGLVFTITVPIVNHFIDEAALKTFNANAEAMREAAENYFVENAFQLPTDIGQKKSLNLNTLVSEGYIKELKNPRDESIECQGYVLVTRTHLTTVSYEPFLNCGASFQTVGYYDNYEISDEGLITHYTFDDFQEPTENLANNPSGSNITNPVPGAYQPGWDVNLHTDAITVSNWGSGYNGGVASPTIGYHAKWVYKNPDNTDPVMLFIDENDQFGLGHRWLGISQTVGNSAALGLELNMPITVSWIQKANVLGKGANVGLYHYQISTGIRGFESNIATVNISEIDTYERASFTSTVGSNWDLTKDFSIYVYGHAGAYGRLWVDDVQIELKPYATPFVNGSRNGIVTDYAGNYDATLDIATTPRWISTGINNTGAYQFDGVDKHILVNFPKLSSPFTISFWAKRTGELNPSISFAGLFGWRYITELLQGIRLDQANKIYFHDYLGSNYSINSNVTMELDKWYNIVYSYDGSNVKVYINGNKAIDTPHTLSACTSNELQIGAIKYQTGQNRAFNGIIDNIRIYDRILEEYEIEFNYDIERPK
ncbi:MAG: LamG-like jellyroll fold domain-containing protein [Bacilli bacterium]|jgi:prepilin-type N-terminal cleavage/methylation domain-containing protein